MREFINKRFCILLAVILIIGSCASVSAAEIALDDAITDTAEYIYKAVKTPQVGSIGGEWAVLGLARSGYSIPEEYYQNYYATVEEYVKACDGILHPKKYTEYSRLIVALTAIGKDPSNVAGYNILTPLGDYDKTIWQGLNGPIWALIALDSGNYEMPQNSNAKTQATRDMYVNRILECQLPDGGFSLFGGTAAAASGDNVSDPDITGMALQALAKYKDRENVKKVIEEALTCMSKMQKENGGYASWGTENSESCVQMIVALCELGISLDDPRFVKNGNTLLDNLITYYKKGNGFNHTNDGSGSNQMASEQGFYGMLAAKRLIDGKNSLYRMNDSIKISQYNPVDKKIGLDGKHQDVKLMPIKQAGRTFLDISAHKNQPAIKALAAREIISGKSETEFEPDSTMTRAEFAAIIVRGLGLEIKGDAVFSDVLENDWFFKYVNTAYSYKIVTGMGSEIFNPNGTITREEAAVMIARAAKLCGMNTDMSAGEARDILAGFTDYVKSSEWSRASLAFCYKENILPNEDIEINPKVVITRAEIAQMLFNMLGLTKLL